jgi:hypothetical protein
MTRIDLLLLLFIQNEKCFSLHKLYSGQQLGAKITNPNRLGHFRRSQFGQFGMEKTFDFVSTTALFATDSTDINKDKEPLIKLPILQIIKANEIIGEFICGNDLPLSIDKFQAVLTSLQKQTTLDPFQTGGNYGVSNIYSEDQLENTLQETSNYVILKLSREGCKKCAILEPIIDGLSRDLLYSKFKVSVRIRVKDMVSFSSAVKQPQL